MLDLASTLSGLRDACRPAPWPGCEYVKGWVVFGLPFDSGHVLALRVMPEGSIAPYRSLWHRDPRGRWSLYVHGTKDCACTRYYGTVCDLQAYRQIAVDWTGPATARVTLNQPPVEWTFTATSDRWLDLINPINAALPFWSWRSSPLRWAREKVARALGMGDLHLSGITPSGHVETLMPERFYFIDDSHAVFDGVDLGRPVHLRDNPKLGTMALPARGVLARAQAMWRTDVDAKLDSPPWPAS